MRSRPPSDVARCLCPPLRSREACGGFFARAIGRSTKGVSARILYDEVRSSLPRRRSRSVVPLRWVAAANTSRHASAKRHTCRATDPTVGSDPRVVPSERGEHCTTRLCIWTLVVLPVLDGHPSTRSRSLLSVAAIERWVLGPIAPRVWPGLTALESAGHRARSPRYRTLPARVVDARRSVVRAGESQFIICARCRSRQQHGHSQLGALSQLALRPALWA
jgi:hypothetical protein